MTKPTQKKHLVAVIGAGPAGLYAAQYLARQGVEVVLFNRDIKPGGLAEYGIYPDKHKMRSGLRAQFQQILAMPEVEYQGNVTIGQSGEIKLDQLRQAGFQAFMVTTGAQQNNWLGLPGEDLEGVYQANDIVFHYNRLPERAQMAFDFGNRVAVIGAGNVMLDILHFIKERQLPSIVTAYARRGPTEVKFDKQTLIPVAGCLDMPEIKAAVDSVQPMVEQVGKNVAEFYTLLAEAQEKASNCDSGLRFRMRFLRSPQRLIGDNKRKVTAIVFTINRLVRDGDRVIPRATQEIETIPVDSVIFSIGSRVDEGFGLPVDHGHYVTAPNPRYPVDGISYEVYNPELCANCEDIFVSGWARLASEGVVGLARKDAERGARAVLQYLAALSPAESPSAARAIKKLPKVDRQIVNLEDLEKLWQAEQEIAAERSLPEFKFDSREAMLRVINSD